MRMTNTYLFSKPQISLYGLLLKPLHLAHSAAIPTLEVTDLPTSSRYTGDSTDLPYELLLKSLHLAPQQVQPVAGGST